MLRSGSLMRNLKSSLLDNNCVLHMTKQLDPPTIHKGVIRLQEMNNVFLLHFSSLFSLFLSLEGNNLCRNTMCGLVLSNAEKSFLGNFYLRNCIFPSGKRTRTTAIFVSSAAGSTGKLAANSCKRFVLSCSSFARRSSSALEMSNATF